MIADLLRRLNTSDVGLIVAATIRTDRYEVMQSHAALDRIGTVLFERAQTHAAGPLLAGHHRAGRPAPAMPVSS